MSKFRGSLPSRGPLPFRYVFLLTFVFFIFSTAAGLWVVNKGIQPSLEAYALKETERIATLVIRNAINKQITEEDFSAEEMLIIKEDSEGNVSMIDYNTTAINRIITKVSQRLENNLRFVNSGDVEALELPEVEIERQDNEISGFYYEIPLGDTTNNVLLGNLGPKIPVRFHMVGSVVTDYEGKITERGINSFFIELIAKAQINIQVIIPFATKEVVVPADIPIKISFINGEVPQFYNNGGEGTSPAIELPSN